MEKKRVAGRFVKDEVEGGFGAGEEAGRRWGLLGLGTAGCMRASGWLNRCRRSCRR